VRRDLILLESTEIKFEILEPPWVLHMQVIKNSDVTILWNLKNYPTQVQMHMKHQIETIQHLKKNESSKIF
jgi:hypothetical protein